MDLDKYKPNREFSLYKTDSGELDEKVVCSNLELTTQHGAIKGKKQIQLSKFLP